MEAPFKVFEVVIKATYLHTYLLLAESEAQVRGFANEFLISPGKSYSEELLESELISVTRDV